MLDESLKWFLGTKAGREFIIEKSLEATPKENNWQSFHTPYDLCEKMISKTDVKEKSILVLFNIEFIKVLIEKFGVHSNNITFLADCRLESEMATKTFHVNNTVVHNIEDIQEALKNMGKTFDLCFSNPPYGKDSIDIKILTEVFKICNEIVSINSIRWALYSKPNIHETHFIDNIKNNIKSIEIVNPNDIFENEGSSVRCAILHLQKSKNDEQIEYSYLDDSFIANSLDEVTRFGSKWNFIYNNFVRKLHEKEPYPKLIDHIIQLSENYDKSKFYVQIATATGTASTTTLEKDDYFTLIPKNDELSKTVRKISFRSFEFDTVSQQENFINFMKSDFVRFCVAIYKVTLYIRNDVELQLVPWMGNFNEVWDDQKLYNMFNIPDEMQNFIEEFLPDYYDIRNKS